LSNLDGLRAERRHVDGKPLEHAAGGPIGIVQQGQEQVRSVRAAGGKIASQFGNASPQEMKILAVSLVGHDVPLVQNPTKPGVLCIQGIPHRTRHRTQGGQQMDASQRFLSSGGQRLGLTKQMCNGGLSRGDHRLGLPDECPVGQVFASLALPPGQRRCTTWPVWKSLFPCRPSQRLMLAFVLLGPSLMGCGLLSSVEQCKQLADVLEQAKAELATPLPANPPASIVRARADNYRKLTAQLKRLKLDKELDKNRDLLVRHLLTISQHLNAAADAVTHAAQDNTTLDTNTPPPQPAVDPTPGPTAAALRSKQRAHVRRYLQAKTDIEATSVKVAETMHRLNLDCH